MTCRLVSPYLDGNHTYRWLKGNHHGHSTLSDGEDDPVETIEAYEAAGYDYFALSEHDYLADPSWYRHRTSMTLLPAVEVTSAAGQTLMFLGASDALPAARTLSLAELSKRISDDGGLFIADHPKWLYKPFTQHTSLAELLAAPAATAIEIYTGVIERMAGDPYALDLWDSLLSSGRRVFGHATDDQHSVIDRFLGWNCVQWPDGAPVTASGIIEALANGRFYASTGVTVSEISLSQNGKEVRIRSDAKCIRWFVRDGRLAHVSESGEGALNVDDLDTAPRLNRPWRFFRSIEDMQYVRAELIGADGRRAWSQPFFIEPLDAASSGIHPNMTDLTHTSESKLAS